MLFYTAQYLGTMQAMVAKADVSTLACAIDRLADLALFQGRAAYAEHLARRAEDLRGVQA